MALTENKIKYIIFVISLPFILIPHFLYYKIIWVQYLYFIGVPIISAKYGYDKYKNLKKIDILDFLSYSVLIVTIVISLINLAFIEIFVWQISLGTLGIFIGLLTKEEISKNKFAKYWNRFTYLGSFLYVIIFKSQLLGLKII